MGVAASLNSSAEPIGGGGLSAGFKCRKHLLSSGSASLNATRFTPQLCKSFYKEELPVTVSL